MENLFGAYASDSGGDTKQHHYEAYAVMLWTSRIFFNITQAASCRPTGVMGRARWPTYGDVGYGIRNMPTASN